MPDRKLFILKKDIIILLIVLAVIAAIFLLARPTAGQTPIAVITVDGREITRVDLQTASDETFSIAAEAGVPVSFEVRENRIRFVEVDCPDHVCERTGFVGTPGESAVCMPNKTILSIRAAEELG